MKVTTLGIDLAKSIFRTHGSASELRCEMTTYPGLRRLFRR